MPDAATPPHARVDVALELGDPVYIVTAMAFYGFEAEPWFKAVGDLLYGRPGWSCSICNTDTGVELMWSFGAMGSSLFVISYDGDPSEYRVFDYDEDDSVSFSSIGDLRDWLDKSEPRHADFVRRRLRGDASADDWWLLKGFVFDVDVTFDGSVWVATPRKLPVTFTSGSSLGEAIKSAREAIAHEFDAPASLAAEIKVKLRLDEAAASAL